MSDESSEDESHLPHRDAATEELYFERDSFAKAAEGAKKKGSDSIRQSECDAMKKASSLEHSMAHMIRTVEEQKANADNFKETLNDVGNCIEALIGTCDGAKSAIEKALQKLN